MSSPLTPDFAKKIEEERIKRQQQPQAPSMVPGPPPTGTTGNADAALLAAQQVAAQREANIAKREQEAAQATASLDEAERFQANAQQVRAIADESEAMGQQQQQQVDQLAQVHQEEDAAEQQALSAAQDQAGTAEAIRVATDPQVIAQVKPDIADALGIPLKDLSLEVDKIYQETQGIFSGQLDVNNQRQVELAKKIEEGKGFNRNEKIAVGMAMLLPIILGAATGNIGKGLQAAGNSLGVINQAQQQKQQDLLASRGPLEDRQLKLAQGKLDNVGSFVASKARAAGAVQSEAQAAADLQSQGLQDTSRKLANLQGIQGVQQANIKTDSDRLGLEQKIKDFEQGKLGVQVKTTAAEKKSAGYAIRMFDSENNLSSLESQGWMPVELGWVPVNRVKTEEAQRFYRAVSDFSSAILRPQSGAVISDTEYTTVAKDYFPQPGDLPATLADKARSRRLLMAGMRVEAGEAFSDVIAKAGKDAPQTILDIEGEEAMTKEEVISFLEQARAKAKTADPEAVAKRRADLEKRRAELLKKQGAE